MESTLLQTKLFVPPARAELVSRPRLVERLDAESLGQSGSFARKLSLVSAPAGFGKTTLVGEWVQAMGGATPPIAVAWLSLDESDNDPTRFLTYFIAALQTVQAEIGKGALGGLQSPQPPPAEAVLTGLINEIAALPDQIVLVLDDYHLIDAQPIHDALAFLLRRLPPQLHLVIATREDPPLPLARLRARGQLTELRATDLRFTASEAAEFLNQAMGLDLSPEDVAALERRTEGWIAGLQLAAISMQGGRDAKDFVESFTGSHRYVLDYLIEEVLEQQTESVQAFLLRTAILDRLTGSLCDALTGQRDGRATLETLERANLFLVPLDEKRRWYRYHHLFADLLRQRLHQTHPQQGVDLHSRASVWYEKNGFTDQAIEHALRAQDFERAVDLIEELADTLWGRGEGIKLRDWLLKLPVELLFSRPHLCVYHAWHLFLGGQFEMAEQTIQAIEHVLDSSTERADETEREGHVSLTEYERRKLRGRIAAVRAFMMSYRGDVPGIIQYANLALERLPEHDLTWRSMTAIVLGDTYGFTGDMAAAYKARFEALKVCEAVGDVYLIMIANLKLAITLREQGKLRRTVEICRQQMQLAREFELSQTRSFGWLLAVWGEALAELDDLDGAIDKVKKGVELSEAGGDILMIGWSYMCLMRVLFSRGDIAGVEENLRRVTRIVQKASKSPWVTDLAAVWQTQLWLAQNKLEAASQWAAERGLDTDSESKSLRDVHFFLLLDYILYARVLLAQGRLDEAHRLLLRLLEAAEANDRTSRVIEVLLLQALVYQAQGSTRQAIITLEQALTLAEPEGFVRIFVDEGPPMARLLYEALSRGIAPDYARRLLAVFPAVEPEQADQSAANDELIEPLSERELEVLHLIAEGLTNPEIAARLFLSPHTIKAHARNIYGKLNVHSRTQAIARSRSLGILPRQ